MNDLRTALGLLAMGFVAFITALAMTLLLARFAMQRLGGLTGDIYGMIRECVEVGVLVISTMGIF